MQKRTLQADDSMMQGNGVLRQNAEGNEAIAASVTMMRMTAVMGLFLALGLGAGCSGGSTGGGGPEDSGKPDGLVSCARPNDPVDTYLPNMSKPGSNGVLTFTLVESDNAPPIEDRNIWKLKITKADQSPITSEIVPDVRMPRHTHPAGEQPKVKYDADQGLYIASPVYFFMTGYWSAKFTAYQGPVSDGEVLDAGTFYFCVD